MSNNFDLILLKEKIPYTGKGTDELLGAVRRILTDNKYTQKITLEVGVSHICIEKLVPPEEAKEQLQISLHDTIRARTMEEYKPEKEQPGFRQLWEMFDIVHAEGFEVGCLVVGDKKQFQEWLKVRTPLNKLTCFGTPIFQLPDIPSDVVLVCGMATRTAEVDELLFSVKTTIT